MPLLKLQSLTCHDPEDWQGRDEIRIQAGGKTRWKGKMRQGDTADLTKVPSISFDKTLAIDVWDYDKHDPNDHIGTAHASKSQEGAGEMTARFRHLHPLWGKVDYRMVWKVE